MREAEGAVHEPDIEQLRGELGAPDRRRGAEDDDDQRAAIAGGARHHVETGIADEAGLHPGRAGIAHEERVLRTEDTPPGLDRRDAEIVAIFRELLEDGAGHYREIARRRQLPGGWQSVRIVVVGRAHAEAAGGPV